MREADPHGGVFAGIVDIPEIHYAAAVAGAQFAEGLVEPLLFSLVSFRGGFHGFGHRGLEKLGGEVLFFHEAGEHHADLTKGG